MVTQIQLGNFFSSGGRTVLTGGSSGLDVETLVNDLVSAKRLPAVALQDKIDLNAKKSTSITEMQTLLNSFRDASNFLRNPPGVQNAADDVFRYRSASIGSNTAVAGSTYLSATVAPGTSTGAYKVTVDALATQNIQTTNTFALATAATSAVDGGGPLNSGTLLLGASSTAVTLNAGDTLEQVAAKVNAVKAQSGVEATIIKVSDGNYRLSFKTIETGAATNYDIAALNPTIFNTGFSVQQNAVDAQITLDGTTITRSSNSISDIITGVTFNLQQTTPLATELELQIDPDTDLVKQGIINFVDSYNAFRLFVSRQSEIGTDGQPTEDSVLAGNSAMLQSMTRISNEMQSIVSGLTSGDPTRLADIGISFSDYPGDEETPFTRNIMTVNESKLDSAIQSDFDAVRRVFEFDMTSDDPKLTVFTRSKSLGTTDFTLNIDYTGQIFQATYTDSSGTHTIDLDKRNISGGGVVLTGQSGTVLEGLSLIYAGTTDATVTVHATQGVADRVYNTLNVLLDEDTGIVPNALATLTDTSTRYQEEIDRIDEQMETYRQSLLNKFASLESAIASANTILQSLDAQSQARASA